MSSASDRLSRRRSGNLPRTRPLTNHVKLAIIYYSSTGTIHAMAERLREAGEKAGAEVRLRQVAELAPAEAIASNAAWSQHFDRTKNEPKATADDVVWADAVLFGTPTRYGNVASQLKQFLDSLGPQWGQGLLADKAYAGFTATHDRARRPGVHAAGALQHDLPLRRHRGGARLHRPARSSPTATRTASRTSPAAATTPR